MEEGDWDSISREVISLFTALTDESPIYMICLDWDLISTDFEDDGGWTKWSNDGSNLKSYMDSRSATFIIFSSIGIHELEYFTDKEPVLKHIIRSSELSKFKLLKLRHDKLELRIQREKDFILGKMDFVDSYKLDFNSEKWDYIRLRRHMLIGTREAKKVTEQSKPKPKTTAKTKAKSLVSNKRTKVSTTPHARKKLRAELDVQIKQPHETVVDDYQESINNAKEDIKALKKLSNRKAANSALEKMREAAEVIKHCDSDVRNRNGRIRKLKHELVEVRKKPMRKLEKKARLDELARKIEMIDKMNEKELMVKTQRVQEFCSLREAILTLRTNENKLTPSEIELLIQNAVMNETLAETKKKLQHKNGSSIKTKKKAKLLTLEELVEAGNKEQWEAFFTYNLKHKQPVKLPSLELGKCKFRDYGYRQLIELIMGSTEFLRIITEVKDVSGFNLVELNHLIRGDNSTLRGLETLCSLLVNGETRYNPVSQTDFKYLNLILDAITIPKKDGINRVWTIKSENTEVNIIAEFDKRSREWIYHIE